MALRHFFYKRKEKINKLDENGDPIPVVKDGQIVGTEQEEVTYIDHFDLTRVIRSYQITPNSIIVLLDDGHETTDKVPVLKAGRKNKKGPITPDDITEEKQRVWMQSQIQLDGDDVHNFRQSMSEITV